MMDFKQLKIFVVIVGLLIVINLSAQTITKNNPAFVNSSLTFNTEEASAELIIDFQDNLSAYRLSEGFEPIHVTVCFVNARPTANSVAWASSNSLFSWRSDKSGSCLIGEQRTDIEKGQNYKIEFDLDIEKSVKANFTMVGYNANIQPSASLNHSNDLEDDNVNYFEEYTSLPGADANSLESIEFSATPNPVVNDVNISLNRVVDNATIEVINSIGQLVMRQTIRANNHAVINFENLADDVYTIAVIENDNVHTEKVIKIR